MLARGRVAGYCLVFGGRLFLDFAGRTMSPKQRFPPEPETRPDAHPSKLLTPRPSGPAPKSRRERAEAPTLPPPRPGARRTTTPPGREASRPVSRPIAPDTGSSPDGDNDRGRASGVRPRRAALPSVPAATVDEVVADLTNDPRRERDDEE